MQIGIVLSLVSFTFLIILQYQNVWSEHGGGIHCVGSTPCNGTDGDDQMSGDNDANRMNGNGGYDVMSGYGGDDDMNGNGGVDYMDGRGGNDHILGVLVMMN
jgi:hypothetical protein